METEIKFRISDIAGLQQALHGAGFQEQTPRTHEMNTLYDLPGRKLFQRGELLRIRQYGEAWLLTHKAGRTQAGDRHKTRAETETAVRDGEALERIFCALGLEVVFRYEKFRSEWSDGSGHVVIDETPIGNFGEIEGEPAWIDGIAAKLGISPGQYITGSYAELFFAWKSQTGSSAAEMTFAAVAAAATAATRNSTK